MQELDCVVIASAARTPIGSFLGAFAEVSAATLASHAIAAAVSRSTLPLDGFSDVIMGCVLSAGQGQAPARQAALQAGLPQSTPATTVNKMCGSGMKAIMLASDALASRPRDVVIAGGMESMTRAPYLLPKMRSGMRLGHGDVKDHMFVDGLQDPFGNGQLMGCFAEDAAQALQITRDDQDAFAIESLRRAQQAQHEGSFLYEIVPVPIGTGARSAEIKDDEQPRSADVAKIPLLKPAFRKDGTVTPANSSSISDGAAALVLLRESEARRRGLEPIARIAATATHATRPSDFPIAPVGAIEKVIATATWRKDDVDLFEVNEAFAVVALAAMRQLNLPHEKVNVNGGACALGHPIGASGARIVVTLLAALRARALRRGVAAACLAGGEATAIAVERL